MRSPKKRWFISHIAVAAMLLQALLPFFAVYQTAAIDTKQAASFFGEKVLICTGDGFRFVTPSELQAHKQQSSNSHQKYQCALCYVAAHGTGIGAGQAVLAQASFVPPSTPSTSYESVPPADHDWRQFLTRSPPFSFVG